jgi:transcriptional regulator with XRE-family HTH domain
MKNEPRNRIASLRKARGLTQQELADAVGAHWITISKLERGRASLSSDWRDKLARALGVSPRDLLPDTGTVVFSEPEARISAGIQPFAELERVRFAIDNSTYEPFLHPGDAVLLSPWWHLDEKQRKKLEGRLCYFNGGKTAGAFGFLYPGKKSRTYDLFWLGGRTVTGAKARGLFWVTAVLLDVGII